jgi:uncharacterized protein (TIGR01777 family)
MNDMNSSSSEPAIGAGGTVAVSGSTGLVGSALVASLAADGYQIKRLVRHQPTSSSGDVLWDPASGRVDGDALAGVDVVVHLAGENIAAGRWTKKQKERIRASRVEGTRLLCEALAWLDNKPRAVICASAIGYYGNRGGELLDEQSSPGKGFLSEVCQAWEAASEPARDAGIRTVNLRIGVVLSPDGGALRKMLTPFKMGVGGVIGSGHQMMSWIALDDVIGALRHVLANNALSGPVNAVAPRAVTNREFTKTLGRVLHRPTIFPMPAFAARLAFGEMGDELLLSSTRVRPSRLNETGYMFQYSELEAALRHLLNAG